MELLFDRQDTEAEGVNKKPIKAVRALSRALVLDELIWRCASRSRSIDLRLFAG
jgi:hypothetical protein